MYVYQLQTWTPSIKVEEDKPKKQLTMAFAHLNQSTSFSKRKLEPPMKFSFELPHNFPQTVTEGLEDRKLSGKARSKFLSCVAAAIYMKKCYPTSDEYRHIGDTIIKTYPFLKSLNAWICKYLKMLFMHVCI